MPLTNPLCIQTRAAAVTVFAGVEERGDAAAELENQNKRALVLNTPRPGALSPGRVSFLGSAVTGGPCVTTGCHRRGNLAGGSRGAGVRPRPAAQHR